MLFPLLQKIKTNEEEAKNKTWIKFCYKQIKQTFWENLNQYFFYIMTELKKKTNEAYLKLKTNKKAEELQVIMKYLFCWINSFYSLLK